MRKDLANAERNETVRQAALDWKQDGLIDANTLQTIRETYPDDRRRLGIIFRALVFLCTLLASGAGIFLVHELTAPPKGFLLLVSGGLFLLCTAFLKNRLRLADYGAESATALIGSFLLVLAVLLIPSPSIYATFDDRLPATFGLGTLIFLIPVYLWGSITGTIAAVICLGNFLMTFPLPRLSWALASLFLIPLALRGSESAALPPSYRRCWSTVILFALGGLYTALNLVSWDSQYLEQQHLGYGPQGNTWMPSVRFLPLMATALMPPVIIAWGIGSRRRLLLGVGLAFSVCSLITLRYYVHIAPLWVILTASGGVLLLIALSLRRWLASGPGWERGGFTAEPLFGDSRKEQVLQTLAGFVPSTPLGTNEEKRNFEGGGGRSGGAGATGDF